MMTPRLRRALGPLSAFALLACHLEEPFVRDNHWDAGSSATKSLTGPDSTYSLGERFAVTLTGDPPFPSGPLQIEWLGGGSLLMNSLVLPGGDGEFVVANAWAGYNLITVGARFGDAEVSHQIWVGQSVASLTLSCSGAFTGSCDGAPLAIGGTLGVSSMMRDGNGNLVEARVPNGLGGYFAARNIVMERSTFVSRNPAVLSVAMTQPNVSGTYTLQGVGPGGTWFVVISDRARDSVRVTVAP